jgi:hypothetical protein
MSKKRERYPRARAIIALGKGDHLLDRVETVTKHWVDVWFDGAEQVFSESKAALASGSNPWLQIVSTSSALSLKAVGVAMEGFATLLGCEPDQTIKFTFDAVAESTDPLYFQVPKGFLLTKKGPLVMSDGAGTIDEDQIWVEPEDHNKTFWSIKLRDLKKGVPEPKDFNLFKPGDYKGVVVFTNDAKDELKLGVTATRTEPVR